MGSKARQKVVGVADSIAGIETDQHETAQGRVDQSVGLMNFQHDYCLQDKQVEGRQRGIKYGGGIDDGGDVRQRMS